MNQLISVCELINLYLYHNSDQKTSPEYTLKLKNQYKTTFFFPTVISLFGFKENIYGGYVQIVILGELKNVCGPNRVGNHFWRAKGKQ